MIGKYYTICCRANVSRLGIVVFVALMMLTAGCRSHTAAVKDVRDKTVAGTFSPEDTRTALLADASAPWTAVTMPAKLSLLSPVSASMSGRITMERGKCIYISLRMLGMEVAYVYADTDSLYAVDKFHRRYFSADISSLSSRYGMTLGNLQNFMLGRIFTFTEGGNAIPDARNVVFQEREICLLEPESDGLFKSIFIAGTAADNMPALISFAVEVSETRGLTCHYGTPVRTAHGTVVTDITLQAVADDINGSARIEWTPDEAKWDDRASSVKFRRPSGYVRVSAEQILAMLGKKVD